MSAGEMGTAAGINALLGMGLGRLAQGRKVEAPTLPKLEAPINRDMPEVSWRPIESPLPKRPTLQIGTELNRPVYVNDEVFQALRTVQRPSYINPEVWQSLNRPLGAKTGLTPPKAEVPRVTLPEMRLKVPEMPKPKTRKQGLAIPIDERTFEAVGNRKVNAYQYDHPEVKQYIQAEAERLLQELKGAVKGEKVFGRAQDGTLNVTGTKRFASEPIERILDNTNATYAEIENALQRIIKDEGAENQALAKRIELIIDDNLTDGAKTFEGIDIQPNADYVAIKNRIQGKGAVKPAESTALTDEELFDMIEWSPFQPKDNLTREGSISAAKFTVPEKMAEVGDGTKVRSLGVSAMNNPEIHPDVKAGLLMETYEGGAGTYKAITNKETIAQAQKMIADDTNGALRHAKQNPGTALSNTIELEMVKKANAENRFDDAIDIINEVSQRSTTQGQAIQSLRLWGKMSPEGMQKYYVNTINKVNKDIEKQMGKNAKKINTDPKIMEDIKTGMDKAGKLVEGRERDIEIAKVLDKIAAQVPAPFLRKVATVHTMAQLLNPKTAIRNIVGNVGFMGMENVSGVLGAAIDRPLSLLTGKRTKVLPDLGAQAKGFKQGWKHGLEDALLGIDTSAMATKFDLPQGRVFRKGFMGKAETAMNIELRATDRAFYRAAYEDSLSNQMRAAKTNTPTEEMMNTAHLDGLYRTFQDENALTAVFVGLKKLMNDPAHTVKFAKDRPAREFGMGDFIVKYPRTPANLLSRGLAYSPAGFTKSLIEMAKPLAKKKFDQRAFVDSFSRATVGSAALFGTGALLHKLGIITGKRHDDYDLAELQNQQGFGEYRINASALKRLIFGGGDTKPQKGDKIISYDWFQPQAIPLAIGADIDANRGTEKGLVGPLLSALATGINAFAEQPVVQGIQTLFSGGYGDYSKGVVKVLENVPSSFIPTLLSQVRQLVDNQRRETYDPMKGKESINRVKAKIPGLASTLPEKYGTLGQPLGTYPSGNNTPFNVFLNPAFVNTYNPSPEVQRVQDIYDMTGATNQVPRIADKSITISGKKFTLSGQEYSNYQRLLGEYTQQEFAKMRKDLKPEDAAKKMQDIMTDANTKAKKDILEARGERVVKKGNGLVIK
ncbi:MAG: hypothetical protein WC340_15130 [Kiritimatiellia bacterium]